MAFQAIIITSLIFKSRFILHNIRIMSLLPCFSLRLCQIRFLRYTFDEAAILKISIIIRKLIFVLRQSSHNNNEQFGFLCCIYIHCFEVHLRFNRTNKIYLALTRFILLYCICLCVFVSVWLFYHVGTVRHREILRNSSIKRNETKPNRSNKPF